MILLFGAGGQIGQELSSLACERQVPLRGLQHRDADITRRSDVEKAITETRPSVIVNAAAYTGVDGAEIHVSEARRANAEGPALLATVCSRLGLPLVHLSTDYVFDGTKSTAYVEDDPVCPINVYGRTKAEGEIRIRELHRAHVIIRTSWVYGVYGHNIVKTVLRLATERDELQFVADQRGCPTNTIDIADAILIAAQRAAAWQPIFGTYHFAAAEATSWFDLVRCILDVRAELVGHYPALRPIATAEYPTAARRPMNSELSSDRFADVFGLRAKPWRNRVEESVRSLLHTTADQVFS